MVAPAVAPVTAVPAMPIPAGGIRVVQGYTGVTQTCVRPGDEGMSTVGDRPASRMPIVTQCCEGSTCRRFDPAVGHNARGCFGSDHLATATELCEVFASSTYAQAIATCSAAGLTLCADFCQNAGCCYNSAVVWTSLPCDHPPSPH